MKSTLFIVIALICSLLIVVLLCSLSYIPLFNVEKIVVTGFDTPPESALKVLSPLYDVNRFKIDRRKIEAELEASPLIKEAVITFSLPALMHVSLIPNNASCILYDESSYYLLKDGYPSLLNEEDAIYLSKRMCVVNVSNEYLNYLIRYGADEDLLTILSKANEVSNEQGNLITGIKYDNNSSGAGGLIFYLEPLSAQLCVRDRVSVDRIAESIRIIEAEVSSDEAGRVALQSVRYDLYSSVLVRRN